MRQLLYRLKYRYAPILNLRTPVDVSLELASYCTNSCGYCLDPDTPVLKQDLSWAPIKTLKPDDLIIGFDELSVDGTRRKMRVSVVEKKWSTKKETIEIVTDKGSVIASLDHRFLDTSSRWTYAKNLSVGQNIKFAAKPWESCEMDLDYIRGYLRGMTEGDGAVRWEPTKTQRQVWWRVALKDGEPLIRCNNFLKKIGIHTTGVKLFSKENGNYARINKIEFRSKSDLKKLYKFLYLEKPKNQKTFECGYLAGIFDAEGSYSEVIRISQKQKNDVLERTEKYIKNLGIKCIREKDNVRITGGEWESLKFLGIIRACVYRKIHSFIGGRANHTRAKILKINKLGVRNLIDIQTSTKTFYGAGFPTHNCYHADPKNLPFKRGFMSRELAFKIITDASQLGVNSIKTNFRGESTMNPAFEDITAHAKRLASGSTLMDRITNTNMNFKIDREDIFRGLCNQTKVKVSFDSFIPKLFEKQRKGSKFDATIANINKLYNYPGRKNIMVIQSVRTILNKDEDLAHEIKSRWPDAEVSIRDVVAGRVNKDVEMVSTRSAERQSCIQAHARLMVRWDGKVGACCPDTSEKITIGDCNTQTIKEIFNSKKAKQLRSTLRSKTAFLLDPCKTCSSFESYKGYQHPWNS